MNKIFWASCINEYPHRLTFDFHPHGRTNLWEIKRRSRRSKNRLTVVDSSCCRWSAETSKMSFLSAIFANRVPGKAFGAIESLISAEETLWPERAATVGCSSPTDWLSSVFSIQTVDTEAVRESACWDPLTCPEKNMERSFLLLPCVCSLGFSWI